jgi:hypothetical protein
MTKVREFTEYNDEGQLYGFDKTKREWQQFNRERQEWEQFTLSPGQTTDMIGRAERTDFTEYKGEDGKAYYFADDGRGNKYWEGVDLQQEYPPVPKEVLDQAKAEGNVYTTGDPSMKSGEEEMEEKREVDVDDRPQQPEDGPPQPEEGPQREGGDGAGPLPPIFKQGDTLEKYAAEQGKDVGQLNPTDIANQMKANGAVAMERQPDGSFTAPNGEVTLTPGPGGTLEVGEITPGANFQIAFPDLPPAKTSTILEVKNGEVANILGAGTGLSPATLEKYQDKMRGMGEQSLAPQMQQQSGPQTPGQQQEGFGPVERRQADAMQRMVGGSPPASSAGGGLGQLSAPAAAKGQGPAKGQAPASPAGPR